MIGFWLIVFAGPLFVWTVWGLEGLYLFASLVIANRLFVAIAGRQNILVSILLHPFQMISFTAIVFYNLFRRMKKETTWKGRKIQL
jgi:chlorobactene glucosyltransferase